MTDLLAQCDIDLPGFPCAWSPCKRYRYTLWRLWGPPSGRLAMFIGLNPSTATETEDDPTIRRCKAFARAWSCSGMIMTNLFAWRATDPKDMRACPDPIGADNDVWLLRISELASTAVAGWGTHGGHLHRAAQVIRLVPGMRCLGLTKDGHPRHPLYVPASTRLRAYP